MIDMTKEAVKTTAAAGLAATAKDAGSMLMQTGKTALELVIAQQLVVLAREGVEISAGLLASSQFLSGDSWLSRRWPVKKVVGAYHRRKARRLCGTFLFRMAELALTALVAAKADKIPYLSATLKTQLRTITQAMLVIQTGQLASDVVTPRIAQLITMVRQFAALPPADSEPPAKA